MTRLNQTMYISVRPDGELAFIYDDALLSLMDMGRPQIRRASHVEPAPGGGWQADLSPVGGPMLGPFRLRAGALEAEAVWLREHLLQHNQLTKPNPSRTRS